VAALEAMAPRVVARAAEARVAARAVAVKEAVRVAVVTVVATAEAAKEEDTAAAWGVAAKVAAERVADGAGLVSLAVGALAAVARRSAAAQRKPNQQTSTPATWHGGGDNGTVDSNREHIRECVCGGDTTRHVQRLLPCLPRVAPPTCLGTSVRAGNL